MPTHNWREYYTYNYNAEYILPFEYDYKEDCIPNDTIIDVPCIVKDVEE